MKIIMMNTTMNSVARLTKRLGFVFPLFLCLQIQAQDLTAITSFKIPASTKQVILVITQDWTTTIGKLQRYEADQGQWKKIGGEIAVSIGKSGLAWGNGIHTTKGEPHKKEGDGKAPAGVYSLGTMFGYSDSSPASGNYPYRQATVRDYFVDDVKSPDYNTWVAIPAEQPNAPRERWQSFEKMKRNDAVYEYGIVINHNTAPIVKGDGSAIFFHVWRSSTSATLGCTSMSKENLLILMRWLDATKNPLVIQVPLTALAQLK
jgi:L,D-peptidoglycan transpeptidase YkuD (ErfK/YbiS/YcfS/YnhG family)